MSVNIALYRVAGRVAAPPLLSEAVKLLYPIPLPQAPGCNGTSNLALLQGYQRSAYCQAGLPERGSPCRGLIRNDVPSAQPSPRSESRRQPVRRISGPPEGGTPNPD